MSLSLPADAEVFIPDGEDFDHLHEPGVYCLRLTKPDDLASAWDQAFDTRPAYWDELEAAERVLYVGEAGDVLYRLEDHRDSDKRIGVLQRVCEIAGLRNIWWCDSKANAKQEESQLGLLLTNQTDDQTYVHFR